MTNAVFFLDKDRLIGFTVSGHTDSDGTDEARIACSAVSSAVYMAANTVTDVIGDKADISVSDGRMRFRLRDADRSQDVLRGLLIHLEQLEQQYPQFIHINTEVQHDA